MQSSSMAIKIPEFVNMVRECGLTVLVLYATFLADVIRAAKEDATVKDALKSLNQIIHTGVALNKDQEEWAYENGIRITVRVVCAVPRRESLLILPLTDVVWNHRDW